MNILRTLPLYSSAHGDLIHTVHDPHAEDPATYIDYQYIGDVYIGATLVSRLKRAPDPTTKIGIFNIAPIVRSYLSTEFNPTSGQLVAQRLGDGAFHVTATMKFGEQYDSTAYLNSVVGSALKYFNTYDGRGAGLAGKTDSLATNNPLTGTVLSSSAWYLVPYFALSTGTVAVTVTTSNGVTFPTSFTPSANYELVVLNLAPQVINALYPGAITAATKFYTVQVGTETYRVNLTCEAQYTPYTLHFLNQYGGFESKLFTKVSRASLDIQKKDYGRLAYTVDASGVVSYRNAGGVYHESTSVYASQYREKLTLNTDLLTDSEYIWLSDLLLSPMVFIEEGEYFYPCQIKESNYEPKKAVNDDLTNLTLSVEYGVNLNAQYR